VFLKKKCKFFIWNIRSHPISASNTTIRDVARVAEVSTGTVSRVLNNHKSVRPGVRARVKQVMEDLGYERDAAASSMRRKTTQTVAIAVRDSSVHGTAIALREAEVVLRDAGYTVLLANTGNDKSIELGLLSEFAQRRLDGVIMTLSSDDDKDLLYAVVNSRMPVVIAGRQMDNSVDSVTADLFGATLQATQYLLSLGHRRIALLTGLPVTYPARARVEGYRKALGNAGLVPDESLIRLGSFRGEFAYAQTIALMRSQRRPTAIIAGGMAMLPEVLRGLRLSRLAVGNDVSVIAGCDSDLAELSEPAITAISWDFASVGRLWAETLIQRMSEHRLGQPYSPRRSLTLPTNLLVRSSCKPITENI